MNNTICISSAGQAYSQSLNCTQESQKVQKNRRLIILATVFSALVPVAGCVPNNESAQQGEVEVGNSSAEIFTQRQKNIISLLVYSNIRHFMSGEDSLAEKAGWTSGAIVSTAEEIQRRYETNEVAADEVFREKEVIVSASVVSINRGVGDSYYLELKGGGNMFVKPKARMADGQKEYLVKINKGQKVQLACVVDGMLLGSAILKRCIPSSEWAKQRAIDAVSKMNETTIKNDRSTSLVVAGAVAADDKLPPNSSCETSAGDDCAAEMRLAFPKISKSDLASVLKKYGIDPSKYYYGSGL